MRTTLLYIANAANPKRINEGAGVWRDVKLLEDTMEGMGTSDDMLVRRLIRLHWDQSHFALVNQAYERKYKQTLESRVEGETSGYYQKAVVGLVKGATRVPPTSGPSSTSGKEPSKAAPVPAAVAVPSSTPKNGVAVESNGKAHEEPATPKSNGHSSPKDDKKAKKSTNGKAQSAAAGDDSKDAGELKAEIVY
ncbi:hypothetical protein GYMLUDRAFT_93600 [Collybiopsis luxurians FD-317 M1]|nr:hypothetical protein GYMLUDRAFT_93600 [Collybiopsis luxurians FD-317 M1]